MFSVYFLLINDWYILGDEKIYLFLFYEDILGMSHGNNFSIIRIYRLSFQKRFDWTKWFLEFFLFAKYYPENCCDFLIIIKNSWWMMTVSLLKAFSIFSWLEKMNFNTLSISLELISIAWYRFLIWFEHSEVMKNTVFWVFLFITDEKQEKEKSYFFTIILRKLLINELESFRITFIMIENCSVYFFFLKNDLLKIILTLVSLFLEGYILICGKDWSMTTNAKSNEEKYATNFIFS